MHAASRTAVVLLALEGGNTALMRTSLIETDIAKFCDAVVNRQGTNTSAPIVRAEVFVPCHQYLFSQLLMPSENTLNGLYVERRLTFCKYLMCLLQIRHTLYIQLSFSSVPLH